jgi:hypothetical protein
VKKQEITRLIYDIEDMILAVKEHKFTDEEIIDIFCNDLSQRVLKLLKQECSIKKQCKECGEWFYSAHGNQRFCPPTTTKRSKCENTFNTRVKRQRLKDVIKS